ncbi:MAG: SusC/RagA family TonB-linked outer membrane protein [Draconibacterium sp.]
MKLKNRIFSLIFLLFLISAGQWSVAQNAKQYKGYVYHQDGAPFENALVTVIVGSESKQTTTNAQGYYETDGEEGCFLQISFPQYFTKQFYPIPGKEEKTYLVKEDRFSYERSYTTMTGTSKLRNSNAAVSLTSPADYSKETETVDDIWKGSSTGIYSEKQSGMPGAGSLNILRGIHSLHTSKSPVIIVDGMFLGDYSFENPAIYGNDLFTVLGLNPYDVKEIVFLKDGASTLKYGVRGGNGVILINTKRAEISQTQIATEFSSGVSMFDNTLPMLGVANNRQYLQYQLFNKGLTADQVDELYPPLGPSANAGDYPRWDQNTNWQDEVFRPSIKNKLNFAFSGGDEISKFYFSLGYTNNNGTIDNTNMNRLNARLNASVAVSEKLNMSVNLGFGYTESQLFDLGANYVSNPVFVSLIKSPQLGVYEAVGDGLYQESLDPEDIFEFSNPVGITSSSEEFRKNYFLIGSFKFNYQFNDNWYASLMLGNYLNQVDDDVFIPDNTIGRLPGSEADQTVRKKDSKMLTWYSSGQAGYTNTFDNKHTVDFALGMKVNANTYTSGAGSILNTGTDDFTAIQFGDVTTRRKEGSWVKDNWINSYFTGDYNYKQKYFVSAGVSMDGSSRLGNNIESGGIKIGNNYYAILPSFAAAWDISREESFIRDMFDMFKIKASYSIRGNDMFNNFIAKSYYVPVQYFDITGLAKGGVMNSGISWEKAKNLELGLDMAFMKEKVNLGINYFHENVEDVVTQNNLARYYGFSTMLDNTGAIKMNGLELMARAYLVDNKKFSWETELNLTTSSSEITQLADDEIITLTGGEKINRQGNAPYSFYGWNYLGVFSTDADASAAALTDEFGNPFGAGDAIFEDIDNNHIIDAKDKQLIGNPFPDFWGAFINRMQLGNFSLYAKMSFTVGRDVYNYTRSQLESGSNFFNQTTNALGAWKQQGDNTDVPKWQYGDPMGNARFSTRWIEDASFVRLDDVTLSYNFSLKNSGLKGLQVYVTGQNLLVLTDYLGYDPEFSYGLDAATMGIDYFSAPVNKSYILGVKVNF